MLEIEKGAKEFNIPIIRDNRKLVASVNGGLQNPSSLVFNPKWTEEKSQFAANKFSCPSLPDLERPKDDEDIAFMSVSLNQDIMHIVISVTVNFSN